MTSTRTGTDTGGSGSRAASTTGRAPTAGKAPAKGKAQASAKGKAAAGGTPPVGGRPAPSKAKPPAKKKAPAKKKGPAKKKAPAKKYGPQKRVAQATGSSSSGGGTTGRATGTTREPRPESGDWVWAQDRRWSVRSDSRRPHVRLGAVWFVLALAALSLGPVGLAVLFGLAASLAGAQTARGWRLAGREAHVLAAAVSAGLLPGAVLLGTWGLGAGILVATGASVALAPGRGARLVAAAGSTVAAWLFAGIAAASVVALARIDLGAAVALVLLVSAFDCGHYLMGVDTRWPVLGTVAGMAAVAAVTFTLFVVAMPPFSGSPIVAFGVAVAVLAPLGQLAASAVLPDSRALASGLRRLDGYLLAGPAWLVLLAFVSLN